MTTPIIDLHCDLLSYLVLDADRTPRDPAPRCSLDQLRAGGVAAQVFAIFVPAPEMHELGLGQARVFRKLVEDEPEVERLDDPARLETLGDGPLLALAAVENASGFCAESGRLQAGFDRLDAIEREVGRLLYVSLTWKNENRFGGGNATRRGLKDDGRHLVERLAEKGIAIDLSHASHRLAAEILDFLEARGLAPPVLASHSDFRALRDLERNLPDEIAREIFRRGGVVGLNFLRAFLAPESPAGLVKNARHALGLGGGEHFAFGADFFAEGDVPPAMRLDSPDGYFLPGFEDASCYPRVLELLEQAGGWPDGFLDALAHRNARRFLARVLA